MDREVTPLLSCNAPDRSLLERAKLDTSLDHDKATHTATARKAEVIGRLRTSLYMLAATLWRWRWRELGSRKPEAMQHDVGSPCWELVSEDYPTSAARYQFTSSSSRGFLFSNCGFPKLRNMSAASKQPKEADIVLSRVDVALARSRRIIASWLSSEPEDGAELEDNQMESSEWYGFTAGAEIN